MQRVLKQVGGVMAVAGLIVAACAVLLPWAKYRPVRGFRGAAANAEMFPLDVFDAPRGIAYLIVGGIVVILVGLAAFATGRVRQVAGLAAPVLGLLGAVLVVATVTSTMGTVDGSAFGFTPGRYVVRGAAGGWFALFAAPMLGFAGGLLSLGRATP